MNFGFKNQMDIIFKLKLIIIEQSIIRDQILKLIWEMICNHLLTIKKRICFKYHLQII